MEMKICWVSQQPPFSFLKSIPFQFSGRYFLVGCRNFCFSFPCYGRYRYGFQSNLASDLFFFDLKWNYKFSQPKIKGNKTYKTAGQKEEKENEWQMKPEWCDTVSKWRHPIINGISWNDEQCHPFIKTHFTIYNSHNYPWKTWRTLGFSCVLF